MLTLIGITLIVPTLIVLANLEERKATGSPLTSFLTFGHRSLAPFWRLVQRLVSRLNGKGQCRFDYRKPVHRLATMLMLFYLTLICLRIANSDSIGGIELVAADINPALLDLAANGIFYILLALLGVGWVIRRPSGAVAQRLGLRWPTARDWFTGLSMAVALTLLAWAATAIWEYLVPAELFQQQTSAGRLIFDTFKSSLPAALMLSLVASISEEILFRGALQPVFGLLITSLVFVSVHLQYVFTPAVLILFAVSLGFGWLRIRVGTSAAIVAHFLYDLFPFLIYSLATV